MSALGELLSDHLAPPAWYDCDEGYDKFGNYHEPDEDEEAINDLLDEETEDTLATARSELI